MNSKNLPQQVAVVGQGATLLYPQDCYPLLIVRVSDSGKSAWVVRVKEVSKETGHEPARFDGPFPVWSHTYTEEELQELKVDMEPFMIRLGKHGWTRKGTPVSVGHAMFHRNYSY